MSALTSIRVMLGKLKTLWPRKKGQGWDLAKFHEQLHVPDDIERNGAPQNYHTGPTENNHIHHFKRPSKVTQRRRSVLDWQVGNRFAESYIIQSAYAKMTVPLNNKVNEHEGEVMTGITKNASKATITVHRRGEDFDGNITWQSPTPAVLHPKIMGSMYSLIGDRIPENEDTVTVFFASEFHHDGETYRGHPNFRGNGPWYDWAIFLWDNDLGQQQITTTSDPCPHYGHSVEYDDSFHYAPGQIYGFLEWDSGDIEAIVWSCDYKNILSSVFTTTWSRAYFFTPGRQKIPMILLTSTDSLVRICCVIPFDKEGDKMIEVWPRERWAGEFN